MNKKQRDIHELHIKCIEKLLSNCIELNTDLVEVGDAGSIISAEDAKFRRRIYSISGDDKRFPRYSDEVKRCEALLPFPFIEGISCPKICEEVDLVSFSNRPFIDDRTDKEIMLYENWQTKIRLKKRRDIGREEYYRIKYGLPEFVPKSFNVYSRMKNAGSDKFWELVEKAADIGIKIEV